MSGAEHSLIAALGALSPDAVGGVATPPGELAGAVEDLGVRTLAIRGTAGSLALHPLRTAWASAEILLAAHGVCRAARAVDATVVHANTVRAGLVSAAARLQGAPPAVVHVRDVLPPGRVATLVRRVIVERAAAVVATSRYVADRFAEGLPAPARLEVIDNPVDTARFREGAKGGPGVRAALGLAPEQPVLGIVGQVTHWKGHDTLVRALPAIRRRHPGAHLLIVGEVKFAARATRFDNRAFLMGLQELIAGSGLAGAVTFLGERRDVPAILGALDVLCAPSIEEPFGRSVAEAMACGTPVVATSVGGPPELIEHGRTGLLAPPGDAGAWAEAIIAVLDAPHEAARMAGAAGRVAAERFAPERHARLLEEMLAGGQRE
jgi:glycosyltransferase involved in cell wall biosynthesis